MGLYCVPVKKLIKYDSLVATHKVLYDKCPDNLQHKFTKRSKISSHSTRNSWNLFPPKPRLELTKNTFQFTGDLTWNEIPQQHRDRSKSLHKGNETALEKLKWVVATKHGP